jgi:hypothetical protein
VGLSAVTKRLAAVTIIVIAMEVLVFTAIFAIINLGPKEGIVFLGKFRVVVMEAFTN